MQAIIQTIVEKTGISEEQAKSAFGIVLQTIKTKLPDSVASQVDGLLAGKEFDFKAVFNDKLGDIKDDAAEKLEDLKEGASEKLNDLKEGFSKLF